MTTLRSHPRRMKSRSSGLRHGGREVETALRELAQAFKRREHRLHRLFDGGDAVVADVTLLRTRRGVPSAWPHFAGWVHPTPARTDHTMKHSS